MVVRSEKEVTRKSMKPRKIQEFDFGDESEEEPKEAPGPVPAQI